ncbi:hypothetical protein [Pseudogemmobacter sp. W21_MBD1_M6]|uniref:hypothetical protein n=1 Tax=Pseudogemmobacter sp. W21_MBD1_M6 TaxID=3240271 RepID=UPI003F9BFA2B
MSEYETIIVESFAATNGDRRARPVEGQNHPVTMFVECCKKMRYGHALGTKFRIRAKVINREDGAAFLYSSYKWDYEVVQ